MTEHFIKQYVRELKWRHFSAAYIQRQLSVLRSFCSWAVDQRFLRVDPVKKVPLPKLSAEYRREALTKEEAEKLLKTLRYDEFYELRDALLISLILGSGTRLIELHRANVGDFVRKQGVGLLYLQGKGREAADSFVVLVPEIALARIRKDAPFEIVCYIGCGVTTGVGAVIFTAKVEAGANVVVFGLGGIGLNVIQGARLVGAGKIVGIDINPKREALGRRFGMTHFINPKDVPNVVDAIVQLTDGGADYSFECIGNTTTMRQALECCHKGWGQSVIIGVAAAGQEIATRPFQLVTGRVWKGSAFGGARGRTDVPKIVDWYMDGKIEIDPMITHTLPLERINEAFDLMHAGESIRSVVVY